MERSYFFRLRKSPIAPRPKSERLSGSGAGSAWISSMTGAKLPENTIAPIVVDPVYFQPSHNIALPVV